MFDLTNTTFIIPVRIDSPDRNFNFRYVLQYLCNTLKTNIIISEDGPEPIAINLIRTINKKDCKISIAYTKNNSPVFHRTRMLNEMLASVKTEFVVNYDCDVFMEPKAYIEAIKALKDGADLVYPYFNGLSQVMCKRLTDDINNFKYEETKHNSICGHCQFFRTISYKEGGMENENFISYGPEDSERMIRFQNLGYKVIWLDNLIYHIEHSRDENSSSKNPHFAANQELFDHLSCLTPRALNEYYQNEPYLKKYNL